jgi:hypothetical protein
MATLPFRAPLEEEEEDRVLLTIDGQQLDVTDFKAQHPGGRKVLLRYQVRVSMSEFKLCFSGFVFGACSAESELAECASALESHVYEASYLCR